MASQHANSGGFEPHVVNNIGNVEGNVNQYHAPVTQVSNDDLRKLVEECIAELRLAILAAERHNELSSADSKDALLQLEGATAKVRASRGDGRRLAQTLREIQTALSGGLGILTQLAAVVAAVKGL